MTVWRPAKTYPCVYGVQEKWKMTDVELQKSILRIMLAELPKREIIESYIKTIVMICGDDEKALKNIVHEATVYVHAKQVLSREQDLRFMQVSEKHKKEVFHRLLTAELGYSCDQPETIDQLYEDWKKSDTDITGWYLNRQLK